jgi:hypothetical protein
MLGAWTALQLPAKGAFRGEILLGDLSAAQAYAPNRQRALTKAVLAGGGLRPSAPPCHLPAAELFGLCVRDVELAHTLTRITKRDPHGRAPALGNFLTRHIGNKHGLTRHDTTSQYDNDDA